MADPSPLPGFVFQIPAAIGGFCAILTLIEAWSASGHGDGHSRADLAVNGMKWFDPDNFTEAGRAHLRRMWRYAFGAFAAALLFVVLAYAADALAA